MFKFVAFAALLACATAASVGTTGGDDGSASITNYSNQINPDGSYAYEFDTSNGISTKETGTATGTVQGTVHYTSPEGEPIELTFVADEEGYKPSGSHVPQIPEYIQRALDYTAAHPPPPEAHAKA